MLMLGNGVIGEPDRGARMNIFPISRAAVTACVIIATGLGFAGAALAQVPTIDIRNTCRITAVAMVQMMGRRATSQDDFNQCMTGEQDALAQIRKDWGTFSSARATCVQPTAYMPSYVEWLTCLEMDRDLRKMRAERNEQPPNPNAPVTLPIVRSKPLW